MRRNTKRIIFFNSSFPKIYKLLVGARGLEPPTSGPPDQRATRLRHAPMSGIYIILSLSAIHRIQL